MRTGLSLLLLFPNQRGIIPILWCCLFPNPIVPTLLLQIRSWLILVIQISIMHHLIFLHINQGCTPFILANMMLSFPILFVPNEEWKCCNNYHRPQPSPTYCLEGDRSLFLDRLKMCEITVEKLVVTRWLLLTYHFFDILFREIKRELYFFVCIFFGVLNLVSVIFWRPLLVLFFK